MFDVLYDTFAQYGQRWVFASLFSVALYYTLVVIARQLGVRNEAYVTPILLFLALDGLVCFYHLYDHSRGGAPFDFSPFRREAFLIFVVLGLLLLGVAVWIDSIAARIQAPPLVAHPRWRDHINWVVRDYLSWMMRRATTWLAQTILLTVHVHIML